jgi:uncharacterized protein
MFNPLKSSPANYSQRSGARAVNTPDSEDLLHTLRGELPYLSQRFGVARLALYGSFARGSQTEHSDVDILVELSRPLGLEFVALAYYLEGKLGRRVDLATFDAFRHAGQKPHRKSQVLNIQEDLIDVQTTPRCPLPG